MEWLYNGEVVVNSTGQQANLTFDPVEDDIHNRVYTCRANASDVSFTSSITISVQGKTLHRGHVGGGGEGGGGASPSDFKALGH